MGNTLRFSTEAEVLFYFIFFYYFSLFYYFFFCANRAVNERRNAQKINNYLLPIFKQIFKLDN